MPEVIRVTPEPIKMRFFLPFFSVFLENGFSHIFISDCLDYEFVIFVHVCVRVTSFSPRLRLRRNYQHFLFRCALDNENLRGTMRNVSENFSHTNKLVTIERGTDEKPIVFEISNFSCLRCAWRSMDDFCRLLAKIESVNGSGRVRSTGAVLSFHNDIRTCLWHVSAGCGGW